MEHIPVIFTFLGVYFWLLLAVASVAIFACLDYEKGILATVTAVLTIAALIVFGDGSLTNFVLQHPGRLVGAVAGYFAAGGLWSLGKWYLFTVKKLDKYKDVKRKFLLDRGIQEPEVPEKHKGDFRDHLLSDSEWSTTVNILEKKEDGSTVGTRKTVLKIKPIAWENKERIVTWMTYWPWSMIWSFLDDIVRHAFKRIQRALEGVMDWITNVVFHGTEKDFTVAGQPNEKILPQPSYDYNPKSWNR